MIEEVKLEIGIPDGTLIVDGSATPKKGEETVGVARQWWCGRLGKIDNCVVGLYATYVGKNDLAALGGAELYLRKQCTCGHGKASPISTNQYPMRTSPAGFIYFFFSGEVG